MYAVLFLACGVGIVILLVVVGVLNLQMNKLLYCNELIQIFVII